MLLDSMIAQKWIYEAWFSIFHPENSYFSFRNFIESNIQTSPLGSFYIKKESYNKK